MLSPSTILDYTDLEEPGEDAVPVGHKLVLGLGVGLLGQLGDDQAEGCQGLVDVGALLQPLTHGPGLDGSLAASQIHKADFAHLEVRDKCHSLRFGQL